MEKERDRKLSREGKSKKEKDKRGQNVTARILGSIIGIHLEHVRVAPMATASRAPHRGKAE